MKNLKTALFLCFALIFKTYSLNAQAQFFYNKGNGATTAVNTCDVSGGQTFNLSANWSHIVHNQNFFNGGSYLFYNTTTGLAVTTTDTHAGLRDVRTYNMSPGWTHILLVNGNQVLFYNANSGLGVVTDGNLNTVSTQSFSSGWTHVVDAGNNTSTCAFTVTVFKAAQPTVANVSRSGNTVTFSFPTQNGCSYRVEYTDSLNPISWTLLETITGDGSVQPVTDTTAIGLMRFYQIVIP